MLPFMNKEMTFEMKAAYLAAFIDGEEHVGLSRVKKTGYYTREISFNNTDKALFDAVVKICQDLGFPVSVYFYPRQLPDHDQWKARLSGTKVMFERFEQMIPLQAPRKRIRLRDIIESYADRDALTTRLRLGEDIICAQCGKRFYAPPSQRARFCSKECNNLGQMKRVTKICETCGTSFTVIKARSQAKFCSLTCSGKAQAARLSELGKRTIADARSARYIKRKQNRLI